MMLRMMPMVAVLVCAGGCASAGGRATALLPSSRYADTFEAAKEEIISRGFALERVDARQGLIVSSPISTAGAATLWTRTEVGAGAEVESFLHRDRRRVTVRFTAAGGVDGAGTGVDLRFYDGPIEARVEAVRERMHRPGLRLSSAAVRLTSVTDAPEQPEVVLFETGDDPGLAAAVARGIARRANIELVDPPSTDGAADGTGARDAG